MLKKTSILVLLFLISLSLAGCQKNDKIVFVERADAFENEGDNSYSQISTQITRFKDLINESLDFNLYGYSIPTMPITKAETVISSPARYFNETYPNELNGSYVALSIIQNYYTDISSFTENNLIELSWGDSSVFALVQMNVDELSVIIYIYDPSGVVISQYHYFAIIDGALYSESTSVSYDGTYYFDHMDSVYWEGKFYCSTYYYSFEGTFSGISQTYHDFSNGSFVYRRIDHTSTDETRYYITHYDATTEHYFSSYNVAGVVNYYISKQYSGNDLVYYTYEEEQFIVYFNMKYVDGWESIQKNDLGFWLYSGNQLMNLPSSLSIHSDTTYGVTIQNVIPSSYPDISFNLQNTSLTPPITYLEYQDEKALHIKEAEWYFLAFRDNYYNPIKKDSQIVFEHLDTDVIENLLSD